MLGAFSGALEGQNTAYPELVRIGPKFVSWCNILVSA